MYEWLNTYTELENRRTIINFEVKRCNVELQRWSTYGTVQGDLACKSSTETALAKQHELKDIIYKFEEELNEINSEIDELEKIVETFKGLDHKILKLKYMDKMTLNDIAVMLNYSYQHIKNKHSQIMKILDYSQIHKGTF
ncbi:MULTISPECIES: sigma-70 family RNA polymerase sigma factor [Macrococcoides]|uniref:Uncharacterized protein n=1 Tax=Macrococcoides bohemicum TaxID=1903056 RepID=A0A328A6R2_9STAP|nr:MULTISPECIES: sigma-70 family RNA polymerase sigma factor [Macrococcus]QNR08247.1 sigma-70 family RNA polymerase sigma factor [Macrococcus canis]RAK50190.1 hypothetical protein BHX94_01630 [Macrococcus bohemicus]UTG99333.1 sigma-70 family RNA polymerase sigma factor [Macrococcus canis]